MGRLQLISSKNVMDGLESSGNGSALRLSWMPHNIETPESSRNRAALRAWLCTNGNLSHNVVIISCPPTYLGSALQPCS